MPEPEYMPIPSHVHKIACDLVTTKRDEESPVVIRVEDIPYGDLGILPVSSDMTYTVYPVTFVARYAAHDAGRHPLTGERRSMITFDGWDCQHAVVDSAAEAGQVVGDGDNA